MFVKDSQKIEEHKQFLLVEKERDAARQWLEKEEAASVFLLDEKTDPTNLEARQGRPMHTDYLEEKLKKMNPNLVFEFVDKKDGRVPSHRRVCIIENNQKKTLFPYEYGVIYERSLMCRNIQEIIDPDVKSLNRKDLPKNEWIPGQGIVFEPGQTLPGFKKIEVPWSEVKRGWRTVVLRLVTMGLIPLLDAEKLFGADESPEWKAGTGRSSGSLRPWT